MNYEQNKKQISQAILKHVGKKIAENWDKDAKAIQQYRAKIRMSNLNDADEVMKHTWQRIDPIKDHHRYNGMNLQTKERSWIHLDQCTVCGCRRTVFLFVHDLTNHKRTETLYFSSGGTSLFELRPDCIDKSNAFSNIPKEGKQIDLF